MQREMREQREIIKQKGMVFDMTWNEKWKVLMMWMILPVGLLSAMLPDLESHAIGLTEYSGTEDPSAGEDDAERSYDAPAEYGMEDIYGNETGAYVVPGTLYESYNAAYDLYEESLDDRFFFYSNVSNGGFTTQPVSFDIPSNLSYTLEQGGIAIPYTAGTEIKEIGNYVLRLSGDYEGIVYQGTFRFSIREAAEEEETDDADMESMMISEDMVFDPSEEISQEDLDAAIEAAGAEIGEQQQTISEIRVGTAEETLGMAQDFQIETGCYCYTLKSGTVINANVPNGAIVNGSVSLELPDSVTAAVFRNGEPYEISGTNFSEEGIYRVVFQEDTLEFAVSYMTEGKYPMLIFRIADNPIGGMEIYNAPLHTKIVQVTYEGETVYESGAEDGEEDAPPLAYYRMEEDGRYSFTMCDEASDHTYSLQLTRDTQAPQFEVSVKNGRASINYLSSDIASYALTVNGVPQTDFSPAKMEGKGVYELVVTDIAGNEASAVFVLADAINYASWIVFGMLLLLALGAYIVMKKIRGSFKTR